MRRYSSCGRQLGRLVGLALLLLTLAVACAPRQLLYDVSIRPDVISPNADGEADIAEIKYSLSRQSWISIYLRDAQGKRYDWRVYQRRSKGARTAYFGGVIGDHLLPDGEYIVVYEAEDRRGHVENV